MDKKKLYEYKNGNYNVSIYEDGTKIRETDDDEFIAEFPENIDLKISDRCNLGCPFCHENSTKEGENAKFDQDFLWTLRSGTELAIGGGNVFENPQLKDFLSFCKRRNIIANITINQSHTLGKCGKSKYISNKLSSLLDRKLVNGVGVSYNGKHNDLKSLYSKCEKEGFDTSNFVIHVINGIHSYDDLARISDKTRKILILGYKDVRRGIEFRQEKNQSIIKNQESIYKNIHKIMRMFKVVSFDNLAIEQLNMRRFFTTEEWEEFYMGDDGNHTMYIDLVKEEFSMNSCATNRRHKLLNSIDEMFSIIREESINEKTN